MPPEEESQKTVCGRVRELRSGFGTRRPRVRIPPPRLIEDQALHRFPVQGFFFLQATVRKEAPVGMR